MAPLQANNPDPAQLPQGEVLGITAILLTCSYNTKVRRVPSSDQLFQFSTQRSVALTQLQIQLRSDTSSYVFQKEDF